jgi:hypothetical protein
MNFASGSVDGFYTTQMSLTFCVASYGLTWQLSPSEGNKSLRSSRPRRQHDANEDCDGNDDGYDDDDDDNYKLVILDTDNISTY